MNVGSMDLEIIYHQDEYGWRAESNDWAGFSACAKTRDELTDLVQGAVDLGRPGARWYWTHIEES